jgi:hypothetical protein
LKRLSGQPRPVETYAGNSMPTNGNWLGSATGRPNPK